MIIGIAANAALQRIARALAPWYEDKMVSSASPP
jgi:hypothetical protein